MGSQELKVLSVRQPWASLLLSGEDWCENRSWSTNYRGPLWIHASGKIETGECELWGIDKSQLTTSAVLGCVELIDVIHIDELEERLPELPEDITLDGEVGPDFIVGEYCWIVANPRPLKTPIAAKGKLNLWKLNVNDDQAREFGEPERLIPEERYPLFCEEELQVEGRAEPVEFKLLPAQYMSVTYLADGESETISLDEDEAYVNGSARFQAACEKAWEILDEMAANNADDASTA